MAVLPEGHGALGHQQETATRNGARRHHRSRRRPPACSLRRPGAPATSPRRLEHGIGARGEVCGRRRATSVHRPPASRACLLPSRKIRTVYAIQAHPIRPVSWLSYISSRELRVYTRSDPLSDSRCALAHVSKPAQRQHRVARSRGARGVAEQSRVSPTGSVMRARARAVRIAGWPRLPRARSGALLVRAPSFSRSSPRRERARASGVERARRAQRQSRAVRAARPGARIAPRRQGLWLRGAPPVGQRQVSARGRVIHARASPARDARAQPLCAREWPGR